MSACHSLEPSDGFYRLPKQFPQAEDFSGTSWQGRKIAVIKEQYPHIHHKSSADEELLQKLLRRSLLNLPESPSQLLS
jgi:hypothetical protein